MRLLTNKLLVDWEYKLYFLKNIPYDASSYVDAKDLGLTDEIESPSGVIATEDLSPLDESCPYYIINNNLYYLDELGLHKIDNNKGWTCVADGIGILDGNLYKLDKGTCTRIYPDSLPSGIQDGKWTKITGGYANSKDLFNPASFGINNGYLCSIGYKNGSCRVTKLVDSNNFVDVKGRYYADYGGGTSGNDLYSYGVAIPSDNKLYVLRGNTATQISFDSGYYPVAISGGLAQDGTGANAKYTHSFCIVRSPFGQLLDVYKVSPTNVTLVRSLGTVNDLVPKIAGFAWEKYSSPSTTIYREQCFAVHRGTIFDIGVDSITPLSGYGWRDFAWANFNFWGLKNDRKIYACYGKDAVSPPFQLPLKNCVKLCGHGLGENYTHALAVCKVNK